MEARLIYAASERSADLFYITQFFAPDPFLFLRDTFGVSHMLVSTMEIDRARRTSKVDRLHSLDALHKRYKKKFPKKETNELSLITFFLKELNIHHVEVPNVFPLGLADTLRQSNITVQPIADPFWPQRQHKHPAEIASIQVAIDLTSQAMQIGIDTIRSATIGKEGWLYLDDERLSSERVRAEINGFLVRHGASPQHTIVAGGEQGADPHEEGFGPLLANQPIILDIFPRMEKSGYWGDMSRTVCRGRANERLKQAWQAVKEAQEVAFSLIQAGVSGLMVHQKVTDHLTKSGFPTGVNTEGRQEGFFHGTGHGLGLEVHELPRLGRKDQILEAGHVVTVEPGLYYGDMGGVRLEDVVLVEENGCRNLTNSPKFLEI